MAGDANLELVISAIQDESVRQVFTGLSKLLTGLNKTMGSLSSSIDKLATKNDKLKKSTDEVAEATETAVRATKNVARASEEQADAVEKSVKRTKKALMEEANVYKLMSKEYMGSTHVMDMYDRKLAQINRNVKRGTREYGLQLTALQRTETAFKKHLAPIDEAVRRRVVIQESIDRLTEYKGGERTAKEIAAATKGIEKLEQKIPRLMELTTPQAFGELVESFDFHKQFEAQLEKIRKSQVFTQTEKHIQTLSSYGDYAVEIYNRLSKTMGDGSAQRKSLFNDIKRYGESYHKTLAQLDTDIRTSYGLRMDATDNAAWEKYNRQIEDLKAKRQLLIEETTNPLKALTTYDQKRTSIADEAVNISKYAKSVNELRNAYGQWAVNIFEDVTVGVDETSRQFKLELDGIKKYGDTYINELARIESKIRTINNELSKPDYSDESRRSLEERLIATINEKNQYIDAITGSNAVSAYHTKRSKIGDETTPISQLTKYTNKLIDYGENAKTLFDFMNVGLDENSEKIKKNYNAVTSFFDAYDAKRRKMSANLQDVLGKLSGGGLDKNDIKRLQKDRDNLMRDLSAMDKQYSSEKIIDTWANAGSKNFDSVFDKWSDIGKRVSWVNTALQDIRANTVDGSQEQKDALGRLGTYWKHWTGTLDGARTAVRGVRQEMSLLKDAGAPDEIINEKKALIRDINRANKAALGSFNSIDIMDTKGTAFDGASYKKYAKLLLKDENMFGKLARSIIQDGNWATAVPQMEALLAAYNKVIPTIQRLIDVNGLSSEQAKQLLSDEFLKQASLEKTTTGVKKAAEAQLGYNKTTRESVSVFDRMASSMGNMARYAFASSIYYAFTSAVHTTIAAVAEFDQSLKNLQAITDATDNEVEALGNEIKRVAVETRYGINEVAEGATIIGQAGYSATETMSVLGAAMNLAQGSMSSVSASADLLTTVLASFNLQASDAAMVADNMAAAMNYSKLDIDKLRVAFNYVGPVAMDAGASLQEMSAVLMVLANNGMKASTIGTSLRNVFSQLQSPSAALRKAFENQMGSEKAEQLLSEVADKSTDVTRKFEILNEVLGTNNDLFKLFGLRAAGTVSILTKYYSQIREMEQGQYTLGESARMAEKQMEGLANRMANLGASLEVLGVTISEQPSQVLSSMVLATTELVQVLTKLVDGPLGAAIVTLGGLTGSIGLAVAAGRLFDVVFGVKISAAVTGANLALTRGIAAMTSFGAATAATTATAGTATTAFTGLAGAFAAFSTNHPILALLSAITVAVGAMWAVWKVFWKEEDSATAHFQQNLKKTRDEIGLLRTALDYNEKITDDSRRKRNNAYVASQIPSIAPDIVGADSKEATRDVLIGGLASREESIIDQSLAQLDRTIIKLESAEGKRKKLIDTINEYRTPVEYAPELAAWSSGIQQDIATQAKIKHSNLGKVQDEIKYLEGDARVAISGVLSTVEQRADTLFAKGVPAVTAWADALGTVTDKVNEYGAATRKAFYQDASVWETGFLGKHNIAVAGESIEALNIRLSTLGFNGDAIIETYKGLGANIGLLAKDVIAAEKEFAKLDKAQMKADEKAQAYAVTAEKWNTKFIQSTTQSAKSEIAWIDKVRQHEIDSIKASSVTQEEKTEAVKATNEKYYAELEDLSQKLLTTQIQQLITLNELAGKDITKIVKLLIEGDYKNIDPEVWRLIKNSGIPDTVTQLWGIQDRRADNSKVVPEKSRFGVIPKRNFETASNRYDKSITEADFAYETGSISDTEYTRRKIEATNTLLAAQEAYVKALRDQAKTEEDNAKVIEAEADLEKAKAEAARNAEIANRDDQLARLERNHDKQMRFLDEEAAAYENSSMHNVDKQMALLEIEEKRAETNIKYIKAQLGSSISQAEKAKLTNELAQERINLTKAQVEQEKLILDTRTKYIEQEYEYGLQSRQAYHSYIMDQTRKGEMNPYDAQKELWRTSDSPIDGFYSGILKVSEATKTMNEYISEGVVNFRDEWHNAMDEFVDSWWDGTASASKIFGDFVNNIARDWQKRILKMYSDKMFDGIVKSFMPDSMEALYNSYGGGKTVSSDLGLSPLPAITPAVAPVDTAGMAIAQSTQASVNTATNSMATDVANMANQSTSLLTQMTNGAANLWGFLANGFNGLWNNIGSGLSGILASLTFATTASSGGSFWERWLGNSIGMGFQLYSMGGSGSTGFSIGSNGTSGSMALSDTFNSTVNSLKNFKLAKGGVFRDLSAFSNSVLTSPTLFTYGEHLKAFAKGEGLMAEAGPEAIMPLTRDGSGRLGVNASGMSPCINNIYIETPEGYTAEQTSRVANNNGGEDIMFTIVKQTAANVAQPGSPMYRAMQNTFGASQVLTSR